VAYECFVPKRGEGLLAAGRCLSDEHEAMASAIPALDRVAQWEIDGRAIRDQLNRDGAQLDLVPTLFSSFLSVI
jgi:hypothetical protein